MNAPFPIKSQTAQQVWNIFDRELIHKLKPLPEEERADIRLEILSHLYESTIRSNDGNDTEEVRLINAITRLGSPEEYLDPLISDILLHQRAAKGQPLAVLQSLRDSAKKGLLHGMMTLVLGMGYFWVIMIFIMSVIHIVNPDVGIWYYPSGGVSLSFEAQPGATQWHTDWFSVIGILTSSAAYWGLNKLLSYLTSKS